MLGPEQNPHEAAEVREVSLKCQGLDFEQITEELDLHIQSNAQFLRRVTFVLNEFETCPTPTAAKRTIVSLAEM